MVEPNGSTLFICFLIVNLAEGACKNDIWKKFVDCSRLNLEQVPTDISHDVEKLDLSYNILTKIKKEDFYHLSNLRILNLSYNNISSIDNDSLNTNILLENLSLFNNSLTEMPSELLEPLKNLKVLDMSNNFYNSSTLGNVFKKLVYLKNLSFGGPMIKTILKDDFVPIQDIELERFALKTQSSLEGYEVGAFSMVNTRDIWFDIALDKYAGALPLILKDLAGKSFENMRFRNLFEFTYYTESMDIFSYLKDVGVDSLTFYRGKFNEYLLYLILKNIGKPYNINDLLLLSVDFARSPNFNKTDNTIENLSLENLVIQDVTNPDILRFDWTFTWFSNIRNLHIINVNFNFVPCVAWNHMTNLESFNITGNRLLARYLYNPTCQLSLPAIKTFNASDNTMTSLRTISLLITTWSNLSVVDLSFNNIESCTESCIWPSKITTLILHNNALIHDISPCLPLTLEYLDMSNSQLEHLNMNYFNQANNLRVLILRNNKIKFIPTGWKSLSLEVLALEGNSFGVIDGGSFKYLLNLQNLTAGNNPYYCNCDLYAFITETLSDKNISLLDWPDSYYCYHPQNLVETKIEYFNPGKLQCDVGLVVAISVAVTAVVVIICMILCWKYNVPWYLRATCKIIRSKYRSKKREDNREYVYHAFISYSYLDADWVREVLLSRLENSTPRYKLCIHERDFLPGKWIIDNIIDNIENSRKIIFVLSRSFVNSEWCNYELYFAHQRNIGHAFEDVILVVKENVSFEDLPKRFFRLRKMLKAKTYLEWPSDQNRQPIFWVQLKTILGRANRTVSGQDNLSSEIVVD